MGAPNLVRYSTLQSLKEALQRTLGRVRADPPEARLSFGWLRAPSSGWQPVLATEGADVVVRLADGRHYVGSVVRHTGVSVTLALWGCAGQSRRFPLANIAGAAVVGPHDHRAERAVCERQRRGEPAHVETVRSKSKAGGRNGRCVLTE